MLSRVVSGWAKLTASERRYLACRAAWEAALRSFDNETTAPLVPTVPPGAIVGYYGASALSVVILAGGLQVVTVHPNLLALLLLPLAVVGLTVASLVQCGLRLVGERGLT